MIWTDFLTSASRRSEHPAVLGDEGEITYSGLLALVDDVARTLPRAPEKRPGRVVLVETEPLALLVQVLACWSIGLVPVIMREGRNAGSVQDICDLLSPVAVIDASGTRLTSSGGVGTSHIDFAARDEALVICTSGTTQAPKLVALPAESILLNARTIGSQLGLLPGDVVAVVTPLTYMYGLMGGAMSALWSGATIRLFSPLEPLTVIQAAIRREGITVIQGPPSLFRLFLAYWNETPFAGVRLVTIGGEFLDPDLLDRIRRAFPHSDFQLIYGMTEAGPRISHNCPDAKTVIDGYVGRPFAHIDWFVEPFEQDGFPSGAGRLVLRGPAMFLGYISQDGGYEGLGCDGYFRSNDLVRSGPDGGLCFLDRVDRMFKSGGKLLSPLEIETALLQFGPVKEAWCGKEAHPLLGFVPVAEVVLKKDAATTEQDLHDHCAMSLQQHAIPRRFEFRASFAIATSGKRL